MSTVVLRIMENFHAQYCLLAGLAMKCHVLSENLRVLDVNLIKEKLGQTFGVAINISTLICLAVKSITIMYLLGNLQLWSKVVNHIAVVEEGKSL